MRETPAARHIPLLKDPENLEPADGKYLLDICQRTLNGEEFDPVPDELSGKHPKLLIRASSFVTLIKEGSLRGCMGSLSPKTYLPCEIRKNTLAAMNDDPRFSPVEPEEVPVIRVHVSVLSQPEPIQPESEGELYELLIPHRHGLILKEGGLYATYLPAVWEKVSGVEEFVTSLKKKAGLPGDYWSPTLKLQVYHVAEFSHE